MLKWQTQRQDNSNVALLRLVPPSPRCRHRLPLTSHYVCPTRWLSRPAPTHPLIGSSCPPLVSPVTCPAAPHHTLLVPSCLGPCCRPLPVCYSSRPTLPRRLFRHTASLSVHQSSHPTMSHPLLLLVLDLSTPPEKKKRMKKKRRQQIKQQNRTRRALLFLPAILREQEIRECWKMEG